MSMLHEKAVSWLLKALHVAGSTVNVNSLSACLEQLLVSHDFVDRFMNIDHD